MNSQKLGVLAIKLQQNNPFNTNILNMLSEMSDNNPYKETYVFCSNNDIVLPNNVPVLHLVHAKFFNGDLIIIDTLSALMCKNFPNINRLYFYAQDIPWLGQQNTMYSQWMSLFKNNDLHIIAKNQQVYDIFEICCKKPIGISENFNYEEINKLI
jgi:hypothetical protein